NAQTAVKVARSDLQIAEFNLRHSKIYAPSKGKILKRFVETNELVNAGMPIFTFGAIGNDWVIRVGVTERDVLRISLGDTAQVTFDAYPDQKFLATVTEIAEAIDPRSGTFEVELSVDPGNEKLKSGFVARAEIFLSRKEVFALIPIEAFVEGAGNEGFVYTVNVDEQSVRKIPVTVLEVLNDRVAIRSQLSPVDDVVTEGSAYLSDGSAVQLIE
ncbi:MAG: efflux RND transporter periplasmic adaptor subunit, partial [Calditrichae bacterium]|nr:efflux RND transporter periplasmic adaptor subunit [Calditrichia bacterium]NIW79542.1 efflux RND transporter periplasmic adaptor subunit [Calditrichia bacterium]